MQAAVKDSQIQCSSSHPSRFRRKEGFRSILIHMRAASGEVSLLHHVITAAAVAAAAAVARAAVGSNGSARDKRSRNRCFLNKQQYARATPQDNHCTCA